MFVIACSHRRQGQHKTVFSCLVRVGGVNTTGDKTTQFGLVSTQFLIFKFSVVLNIFETEQLQIGNWVETRQNCLVLSPILFTPPIRTRPDKTILSCQCWRCEQAYNVVDSLQFQIMFKPSFDCAYVGLGHLFPLLLYMICNSHLGMSQFSKRWAYVNERYPATVCLKVQCTSGRFFTFCNTIRYDTDSQANHFVGSLNPPYFVKRSIVVASLREIW